MFCNKAIAELDAGNIESAVLLVNSVHSQRWQSILYRYPICFIDHRIQFVSGDGEENKNPTFQNIMVYLGPGGHPNSPTCGHPKFPHPPQPV
jgi:hypothetical protein